MTIMNSRIREELTDLMADHLAQEVGGCQNWQQIAWAAMDFIYGSEHDGVPQPECSPYQQIPTDSRPGIQRSDPGAVCCDGFTCTCCPGGVDSLEDSPVAGPSVMYGVMTREPLQAAFVSLDHPSPTEGYVRLRESGSAQTVQ